MTGPELRTLRKSLKLTQGQLAERLGVHLVTIANYEAGKYPIPKAIELAAGSLKPESSEQTPV